MTPKMGQSNTGTVPEKALMPVHQNFEAIAGI
jgi:hypothetical protein